MTRPAERTSTGEVAGRAGLRGGLVPVDPPVPKSRIGALFGRADPRPTEHRGTDLLLFQDSSSAVFAKPLRDGTSRLVAYRAAGVGYESVRDVHAAFVRALGDRSDIGAPDDYVWCSDVPLDMSDEHEWDGCVVVEKAAAGTARRRRQAVSSRDGSAGPHRSQ